MNVALVGASDRPERYAYRALELLQEKGHAVFPVHPKLTDISGIRVFPSIKDIPVPLHTITLYIGKERSDKIMAEIISFRPERIILNPGAENDDLETAALKAGIGVFHACTILLLETGQF